jgi:cysteine-rich repeat protein
MHRRLSRRRRSGWRPVIGLLIAAVCCAARPAQAGAPDCAGDCNHDRDVTVSELVRALRIALGSDPLTNCAVVDLDGNGAVSIGELLVAVNAVLEGCPPVPSPTHTVSITPTRTVSMTPTPTAPTHTPTLTPTVPPSETPTLTPTASPTQTPTATLTASLTATLTSTPTLSPTPRATPPLSTRVCGNGHVEPGEECDDDNLVDGDGCNALCRSEAHPDACAGVVAQPDARLTTVRIAAGLAQPLHATSPPGDVTRLFVLEQPGRIRLIKNNQLQGTAFLDLRSRVVSGGERGLLGLAFHPQYASNGQFFVDYTTMRGTALLSVVSRFRVTANPDIADQNSEEILLEQDQPAVAHKGGQLTFDAAGYLYIGFGDGGKSAAQQNNAQDGTTWLGKILRIDVDGGTPYAIPADNPFVGPDGVLDEIWAMGLRNPWRFSIDRVTGNTYIADVGDSMREEIDLVPPGDSGLNFGWCCEEGTLQFARCYRASETCPASGLVPPLLEYGHEPACSVTGGFVYRGCALPDLRGTYFYSDFCAAFVRSFVYRNGAAEDQHDWTSEIAPGDGLTIDRVTAFGEDARGELYLCDHGGEVFKIVPAPAQ